MNALLRLESWPVRTAAAAVVGDGGIADAFGPVEREFPLASVTKLLTAYAVLVAVEEGALGLDDPAGPAGATARHLLAHASGLAADEPRALAPPGARRIYSNPGFEALAAAVEAATGFRFGDYLHEAVVEPLGLVSTRLVTSPAYGAVATVADLARFATELLWPRLLDSSTLALATTVAFPGLDGVLPGFGRQAPNDWGLGFELRDAKSPHWTGKRNSPRTFGHFGRSGTFLWVDPDARLACAVLTDREFGNWATQAWPALSDAVLAQAPES